MAPFSPGDKFRLRQLELRALGSGRGAAPLSPSDTSLLRRLESRAQGYRDEIPDINLFNRLTRSGGGRSDRAPTDAELRAQGYGTGVHDDDPFNRRGRGGGGGYRGGGQGGTTPIVTGLTRAGAVDRTQSDTYRQYAGTPEGQFERYFGTSGEMDPYFGAASRGAGAPKNVQDMLALASQRTAPGSTPQDLATYYRAQSAAGRGSMDEIVSGLTYGKTGKEAENLTAWAKANPMLAMREYNKRFPGGQPTMGTGELATIEALQGTRYQGVGGQGFGAATAPGSVQGMDSTSALSVPPELKPFTLPGGAVPQGRAVSAPYDIAQAQAAWKTNPQNWTSQQIPGVSERAEEFIKGLKPFSDSKVDTLF